jgi:2-polyprenyl-3-methyl-5-hydroxy-6-metoxy-1,4-benzoquinol methylase
MSSTGWVNFWEDQKRSFYGPMRLSTLAFASRIEKKFQLKKTDEILDYGCGPGFLADYLSAKDINITGADINKLFISESTKNHPGALFIHITTDVAENKKILDTQLNGKHFDFIVLLSIVQYFESIAAVELVVKMLASYLKKDGKIIIADVIDKNTSSIQDAISLFLHCIKKGKPMVFFRFVFYLLFSNYRTLSRDIKLLTVSQDEMKQLASRYTLSCEKVDGLTIHSSRTSYILAKLH